MKDDNYIVIKGWMINRLQLQGTELILFGVIHGFTQDQENNYTGGLKYLQKATGKSKTSVINNLKKLVEKGLIEKESKVINNVVFTEYNTRPGVKLFDHLSQKTVPRGGQVSLPGGGQKTVPNNKEEDNLSIKPKDNKQQGIDFYPTFEDFWGIVIHKTGKATCLEYWSGKKKIKGNVFLSQKMKEQVMEHYPVYSKSNDAQYITRPHHYLFRRVFEDEIINKGNNTINTEGNGVKPNPGSTIITDLI